ncbi:MAG: pseudouridine synthase, partial [Endomicrobiia bacterium]
MVIAKTPQAQFSLMKQFQTRTVQKTYLGIVHGILSSKKGKISAQLTRDHKDRKKFCIGTGREAITEFKVIKTFNNYSLLEIYPRTGRTHQIRVHLSSIGHPILGDKLYGKKNDNSPRQMLHSYKLKLFHPKEKKEMEWKAKIPDDFLSIMKKLGVLFLVFCFSIVYTNATSNTTQTSSSISTEIKSIKSELKKLTKEVEKIDKISRKVSDLEKSLEEQNVNNQTRLKEINMAVAELNRKITNLEINFEEYKRTSALERIKQQDKESKDKLKPVEKTTSSEEIERISAIETEILLVKKEISMIREKIGITQTKLTQEEESTGNDKIIKFLKSPWAVATALGVSILALLIAVF